jgi:hypothetical protein
MNTVRLIAPLTILVKFQSLNKRLDPLSYQRRALSPISHRRYVIAQASSPVASTLMLYSKSIHIVGQDWRGGLTLLSHSAELGDLEAFGAC